MTLHNYNCYGDNDNAAKKCREKSSWSIKAQLVFLGFCDHFDICLSF